MIIPDIPGLHRLSPMALNRQRFTPNPTVITPVVLSHCAGEQGAMSQAASSKKIPNFVPGKNQGH